MIMLIIQLSMNSDPTFTQKQEMSPTVLKLVGIILKYLPYLYNRGLNILFYLKLSSIGLINTIENIQWLYSSL